MSNITKNWIVIGGGFQGIAAAYKLVQRGQNVTLIEKSSFLGGVLNSMPQEGLFLDLGCHLFTNSDSEITNFFLDILDGHYHPVPVSYSSIQGGHKADGLAVPDFTHLDGVLKSKAVLEIIEAAAIDHVDNIDNVADLVRTRFGFEIGNFINACIHKITTHDPANLDREMLYRLPLSRIRLLDNDTSMMLKKILVLDERLAVPSQNNPFRFSHGLETSHIPKNFYPSFHGTRGFCEMANKYLAAHGVTILTGHSVAAIRRQRKSLSVLLENHDSYNAEHVILASEPGIHSQITEGRNIFRDYLKNVPLVLFYFLIPADSDVRYTYLHDFSVDQLVYRLSSPGFYGKQCNHEGLSYLLVEVPTKVGSNIWNNPKEYERKVWNYVKCTGISQNEHPVKIIIKKTPVSYPVFGKSFRKSFSQYQQKIQKNFPDVILANPYSYAKVDSYQHFSTEIERILE